MVVRLSLLSGNWKCDQDSSQIHSDGIFLEGGKDLEEPSEVWESFST